MDSVQMTIEDEGNGLYFIIFLYLLSAAPAHILFASTEIQVVFTAPRQHLFLLAYYRTRKAGLPNVHKRVIFLLDYMPSNAKDAKI